MADSISRRYPEQSGLPFSSTNPKERLKLLLDELGKKQNRKDLTWLGIQMGRMTNHPPFSYKYLHSVLKGTLDAGWPLKHAIEMSFLRQDGVHLLKIEAKEQTIYSEQEIDGLIVLGTVKTCANPDCYIQFVSDNNRRKYCPFCRPTKRR